MQESTESMQNELRENISKLLVKWNMPTRQAFINELITYFQNKCCGSRMNASRKPSPKSDEIKKKLTEKLDDLFPKGKCEERGEALVLYACFISLITEMEENR